MFVKILAKQKDIMTKKKLKVKEKFDSIKNENDEEQLDDIVEKR